MIARLFRSLTFRLALAYASLTCLLVALLFACFYWAGVARPMGAVRAEIRNEAAALVQIEREGGAAALAQALRRRGGGAQGRHPFHAFIGADGRVIAANLPSWPPARSSDWLRLEADQYQDGYEIEYTPLLRDVPLPDGARLIVGRDVEDLDARHELMLFAAYWILGWTPLLAIAGGVFMARTVGARLDAVGRAARKVMDGDLSGRVPIRATGDDFDRLGETLNMMLERIERLFESLRSTSDNIAHELRTPLARLRGVLEQLDRGDADEVEAWRGMVERGIAEADRLDRILNALLRIARIDSGRHRPGFRDTDLTILVADVAEFHQADLESRGIALTVRASDGLRAGVDPDLLFQALSNLLDNCAKYVPVGGRVWLDMWASGQRIVFKVADDGPGMAPEDADRAAEYFYRGANAGGQPGEGLGLSLVAAIAAAHGGVLHIVGGAGGFVAQFHIQRS